MRRRPARDTHSSSAAKILRCAIYSRVSTEHGLDQDFNSLDAQALDLGAAGTCLRRCIPPGSPFLRPVLTPSKLPSCQSAASRPALIMLGCDQIKHVLYRSWCRRPKTRSVGGRRAKTGIDLCHQCSCANPYSQCPLPLRPACESCRVLVTAVQSPGASFTFILVIGAAPAKNGNGFRGRGESRAISPVSREKRPEERAKFGIMAP
jgi:hypothetical protein